MKRILILFTTIHALSLNIQASPVQVTRIIIPQDNAPALTIDLIHDLHVSTQNIPSDKPFEQYLTADELKRFLPQERAFINTLYQLDQTADHSITLLWECDLVKNQELNEKLKKDGFECLDYLNSKKLLLFYGFYYGTNNRFTKNVHFVPCDTWRPNALLHKVFTDKSNNFNYSYTVEEGFHFITSHFDPNNEPQCQMAKVKEIHPEAYEKVLQLYQEFKSKTLEPIYSKFVLPFLNKKMSLQQVMAHIKKKEDLSKLLEDAFFVPGLMDFELLCTIFGSTNKHVLVYAGTDHCNFLIDTLVNHFNGHVVTTVGTFYSIDCLETKLHKFSNRRILEIPLPQLKKEAWDFILESPTTSWNRYRESGIIQTVISGDILRSIDSLQKNNLMPPICETLIQYASKAYIDIANAQDECQQSLLHLATLYKSERIVALLLSEGALVDLPNLFGTTALLYATAQRDTTIMKLLLDAGANPLKKDATGLYPLVLAYHMKDESLITLLKQYQNNDEQLD